MVFGGTSNRSPKWFSVGRVIAVPGHCDFSDSVLFEHTLKIIVNFSLILSQLSEKEKNAILNNQYITNNLYQLNSFLILGKDFV